MSGSAAPSTHLNRADRRRLRKLGDKVLRDGEVQWRTFCETVNGLPFWPRAGLAWAVLRGRMERMNAE